MAKTVTVTKPEENKTAADDLQDTPLIQSTEDLQEAYPALCEEMVERAISDRLEQINSMKAPGIKKTIPQLFKTIVDSVKVSLESKNSEKRVKGFLLAVDDPFSAGVLRTYSRLKGIDGLTLPYVLPFCDRDTKAALKNYIIRADGSDIARANAAKTALRKCAN